MKKIFIFTLALLLIGSSAYAVTTIIDFENVPEVYWYNSGRQNLGAYYAGVTFGPDATILEDEIYGYSSVGYPPYSGDAVLFSISNSTIRVDFDNPTSHAEVWYTTYDDFFFEAYDINDNLIDSDSFVGINYGTNSFMEINSQSSNIAYVLMHDSGNYYTIDNFGYKASVPEPATLFLISSLFLGLLGIKREKEMV